MTEKKVEDLAFEVALGHYLHIEENSDAWLEGELDNLKDELEVEQLDPQRFFDWLGKPVAQFSRSGPYSIYREAQGTAECLMDKLVEEEGSESENPSGIDPETFFQDQVADCAIGFPDVDFSIPASDSWLSIYDLIEVYKELGL